MQLNLKDKVVLVTGGTEGIGKAIVEGFVAEGARVHFCARTEAGIKTNPSGSVVDIASHTAMHSWVQRILAQEKKIDAVVSNVSSISITDTAEAWKVAYETDIQGTVTLVRETLPALEKSKGCVVTISSVSGRDVDFTAPSPYGSFKAALIHYAAQLAHTLAPKGIRANTVSPGNIYIADGVWGGIEKNNPELFNSQMSKHPMGRMGRLEEVADAVLFLASERTGFISGANLVFDGSLCTGVQF